jgi:hypothetical protein
VPTNDSYVQVAADGSGKKMETGVIQTSVNDASAGPQTVHRQRAELLGVNADYLEELARLTRLQTQLLQAILATLTATSNVAITAEDFPLDS